MQLELPGLMCHLLLPARCSLLAPMLTQSRHRQCRQEKGPSEQKMRLSQDSPLFIYSTWEGTHMQHGALGGEAGAAARGDGIVIGPGRGGQGDLSG